MHRRTCAICFAHLITCQIGLDSRISCELLIIIEAVVLSILASCTAVQICSLRNIIEVILIDTCYAASHGAVAHVPAKREAEELELFAANLLKVAAQVLTPTIPWPSMVLWQGSQVPQLPIASSGP